MKDQIETVVDDTIASVLCEMDRLRPETAIVVACRVARILAVSAAELIQMAGAYRLRQLDDDF